MPIYKYKGYKAGGAESVGTIEADGPKDAALKVRELGVYPKDIELDVPTARLKVFKRKPNIARILPSFTRQMGVLIRAGVPLLEALRALSDEERGPWKTILVEIRESVSGGASLSRAMEAHSGIFPDYFTFMVSAGEESGTLESVLSRLADFLELQHEVKQKITNAMAYPMVMAFVAFGVITLLFTFVIPKLMLMFEASGSTLPLLTRMLMGISNAFTGYWWLLIILGTLIGWGGGKLFKKYNEPIDRMLMKPFGVLYLARFTRSLGFLMEGGLPILKALELSGRTSGNKWLEGISSRAAGQVSEGASLSSALDGLPPVFRELVSTGERSGTLGEVLSLAADGYEADFDRMVQRSLSLIEPIMILFMAVVVGLIVLSILLPMLQLNSLIGK